MSLELGGKSPLIIFGDCDKDKAVKQVKFWQLLEYMFHVHRVLHLWITFQALSSVFFNKGENCIAAGRLFVEECIHDEFVNRVVSLIHHCILYS